MKFGNFEYKENSTGVTITDYNGKQADVVIPSDIDGMPVTRIANYTFEGSRDILESITIPHSVTEIDTDAFCYCIELQSINVDNDNETYSSREGLLLNKDGTCIICCPSGKRGEFTIPDYVTSISNRAFADCSELRWVTIPEAVTKVGSYAFYNCTSLTNIAIFNPNLEIGENAFGLLDLCDPTVGTYDEPVEDITIYGLKGSTAEAYANEMNYYFVEIHDDQFYRCITGDGLEIVHISDSDESLIIKGYRGKEQNLIIPSEINGIAVTKISNRAFDGCTLLKSVVIPKSVTEIGMRAFYRCTNLESVEIPRSVESIGDEAFSDCTSLKSVKMEQGIEAIGNFAFSGCTSLNDITIPDGIKDIGAYAFSSCTELRGVTIPSSVKSVGEQAFSGCTLLSGVTVEDNGDR